MTQREETRQEEENVDENEGKTSSIDFETLLLRRKAKEAIKESEWSEAVVDDVQIYSGYEFADASIARDERSVTPVRGTIAGENENPREILNSMDTDVKNEYTTETSKFSHADGTIVHDGRKVLYRKRKWITVEIRSPDGTYSEEFVVTRTPKFENNNLNEVYKSVVRQIGAAGSIGSPPDSSKTYLRTDQVLNSSRADMLVQSFLRFGIVGSAIFMGTVGAVAMTAATGSFFAGSVILGSVIMLGILLQQRIYDGWFELVPVDWMEELPEDAKITDEVTQKIQTQESEDVGQDRIEFMRSEATVDSFKDGTVVIKTPTAKWTFKGQEDGVPSDEALSLYQAYGGVDFAEEEQLPVQVASYDERIPLKEDQYLSDDGEWVLQANGL